MIENRAVSCVHINGWNAFPWALIKTARTIEEDFFLSIKIEKFIDDERDLSVEIVVTHPLIGGLNLKAIYSTLVVRKKETFKALFSNFLSKYIHDRDEKIAAHYISLYKKDYLQLEEDPDIDDFFNSTSHKFKIAIAQAVLDKHRGEKKAGDLRFSYFKNIRAFNDLYFYYYDFDKERYEEVGICAKQHVLRQIRFGVERNKNYET